MKLSVIGVAVCSVLLLAACEQSDKVVTSNKEGVAATSSVSDQLSPASQADIDAIAQQLVVKYRLVTNIPSDKCDAKKADGSCFEVELSLTAKAPIKVTDWSIFFSQISPIQSFESEEFTVNHINGDIHRIALSDKFSGFAEGETKTLLFRANFWSLSETDALPNYIVSAEQLEGVNARVIDSTRVQINQETGLETLPYVEPYTEVNKHFKRTKSDQTKWLTAQRLFDRNKAVSQHIADVDGQIIPTPKSIKLAVDSRLDITQGLAVNWQNVKPEQVNAGLERIATFGVLTRTDGVPLKLSIEADEDKKLGSYQLTVNDAGIDILGVDANGVFNGLQSLAGLITIDKPSIPHVEIIDEPHYAFRGVLVDVSRNFRSKEFLVKLMDQMAAYKMNKLHLHLGDDEGWRLEIPGLPELTEISSKRCFDPSETRCLMPQLGAGNEPTSEVNGYYSVADYQEILTEANKRFIQVIPSLDMPGHSRAAVKAMTARYQKYMALEQEEKALEFLLHDPQDPTVYSSVQYYNDNTINVCMESSYHFIEQVMREVKNIHQQANQPLTRYHIGADETAGAWVESPQCQQFLAKHNAQKNNGKDITSKDLGAYFVERVSNMLAGLGIEAAAWIDGLEHTNPNNMPAVIQANAWHPLAWGGHQSAHKLANYNWQMVVSSPDVTYFDFPYEADPKEHGYYWGARHVNTQKMFNFMPDNLPVHAEFWLDREDKPYTADDTVIKDEQGKVLSSPMHKGNKFLGIQGQLWSENTRTQNTAEYKIFPRLLALAERGWHQANWAVPYNYNGFKYSQETDVFTDQLEHQRNNAWFNFAHILGHKEMPKLERGDVHYRLPTVGAAVVDGMLQANIAFPGIAIEYQLPDGKWQAYSAPVKVDTSVNVRSVSFDGKRRGRQLTVSHSAND